MVNDKDLDVFIRDLPYNFTIKQALEQLEDPRVLAKVGQYQTLSAGIPFFAKMVKTVQELTKAIYKFYTTFKSSAKKNTPCHALQDFYLADALPHQW